MPQSLNQTTVKDVDTAFGKFSRARMCLNHTNRVQQWTKQINHIEDRALKVRLSHIDRIQHEHLDREAAVRRRLANSVQRLKAVQQVFRQYTMLDISSVVRGGDFQVAVSKFVDKEVNKKLDSQHRAQKREGRMRRRYERCRDDYQMTLGRFTSMDLTVKSPILNRRSEPTDATARSPAARRKLNDFSLPYLMLNPMLAGTEEFDPTQAEGLTEEEIAEIELKHQRQFKDALDAAYDIDERQSPTKSQKSPRKRAGSQVHDCL